jgi:hypothetical protein
LTITPPDTFNGAPTKGMFSRPSPLTSTSMILPAIFPPCLAASSPDKCTVTVKNNTGNMVNMAIVDLGIPPGFDVDTSAFDAMQQNGQVAKFDVTGNQVILYLRKLSESAPFQFSYSLRAKYPLRVQTPPSAVYEYYQPQNRAQSKPVELQMAGLP